MSEGRSAAIEATPKASAMLEAMRGMGYSVEAALADIIDNSVAAEATIVRLDFIWDANQPVIRIADNGRGMTGDELTTAMTLGALNPLHVRRATDLGRFGLGLKTASLSQCRRLTVGSSRNSLIAHRRWDLDYIAQSGGDDWHLLPVPAEGSERHFRPLTPSSPGTIVLWEICDRIMSSGFGERNFLDLIDRVQHHLAMVFHRYIEGPSPALRLFMNGSEPGHQVKAWDPFLSRHPATIRTPVERIGSGSTDVEFQGFVLPHHDRLSPAEFQDAAGSEGWTAMQGFYIYRNRRLVVAGGWLGLGSGRAWTKEEPHKLARIRLDLPNSLDADWKLDIRKAIARPPVAAKKRLTQLAEKVRADARRVFAHRGQYGNAAATEGLLLAWRVRESSSGVRYVIDEGHPAVRSVLDHAGEMTQQVKTMLRVIQESVPIQRIWLDTVESGDVPLARSDDAPPSELAEAMRDMYRDLTERMGMVPSVAVQQMLRTAPFNRWPGVVLSLPHSAARNTDERT